MLASAGAAVPPSCSPRQDDDSQSSPRSLKHDIDSDDDNNDDSDEGGDGSASDGSVSDSSCSTAPPGTVYVCTRCTAMVCIYKFITYVTELVETVVNHAPVACVFVNIHVPVCLSICFNSSYPEC